MLDDYTRAHVNRAIEDALHPRGMSIHNGKTGIDAATLQRLVTMIDRGAEASLEAQERIAALEQDVERLRTENMAMRNQRDELCIVLDKRPAMNAGLLEAYAAWSASVYALDWLDAIDDAMRKEGDDAR